MIDDEETDEEEEDEEPEWGNPNPQDECEPNIDELDDSGAFVESTSDTYPNVR